MSSTRDETDTWDRLVPLGGITFVIAYVVATVVYFSGGGPAHDTPGSVTSYIQAHLTGLEASWWLLLVGEIGLLVYLTGIALVFRRRMGSWGVALLVLLAAGAISVGVNLVESGLAFTAFYFTATKASPDVTYALYTAADTGLNNVAFVAVGVTVLAASSLILTTGAFRRWLGWVGIAAGVLAIVSVGAVATDALSIVGLVGGVLALVFVAGTSISMLGRRTDVASRVATAVAP